MLNVILASEINPDHNFDYNQEIAAKAVPVKDLREAREVCSRFIEETGIGGGNWTGGLITDETGAEVAKISYNRRIWTPGSYETCTEILIED